MIPKTKTHNDGVLAVISGPMPMLSLYVCGCGFSAKVEQTWVFERVLHGCRL